MRRAAVLWALAIVADLGGVVRAGVCEGRVASADAGMKWIEKFANNKHAPMDPDTEGAAWYCVQLEAHRERSRIEAACSKILDRDGDGDASPCVDVAAAAGFAKLGTHDLFATIGKRKLRPYDTDAGRDDNLALLGAMDDPRAVPIIVATWNAALPHAAKWPSGSGRFIEWSSWRTIAAQILGRIGGDPERTFLETQAKATTDRHVAQACRAGADAIAKRLAKP
ncbi:MAG: hypothetical protein ABI467_30355 [Kofleriaceae bacterium]